MKKSLFTQLVLLISMFSVNAQHTININTAGPNNFKEIKTAENSGLTFEQAERFRQIILNTDLQMEQTVTVKDVIKLDLFADKQYKAIVEKVSTDVNGTLMVRAKLLEFEYAYCFISTFEGKTFLTIEIPEINELFMTRYIHATGLYYLMQMDNAKMIELGETEDDGVHLHSDDITNMITNNPVISQSPTTLDTITLLLVYTPAAAAWSATNEVDINNTISLMMAKVDLTNANSGTLLDIQLAHSQQISYVELQSGQDLANLRNTNDGNMDSVHDLRDDYCADLVSLLESTNHTGGSAYLLNNINGSPTFGFSILRVEQASWTYTGIHEFGHNLGCSHHKDQNFQAGPGIFSYSAGGRWVSVPNGNYCSIMSYTGGTYYADGISHSRVPYFSNPAILYQGTSTGDSTDADNARTIRNTKTAVAAYRASCTLPTAATVNGDGLTFCDSAVLTATGGLDGIMYWQGTTSGGTSFATPSTSETVTASGTYYFRAYNFLGWGPEGSTTILIDTEPPAAGTIAGPTSVCQGQSSVTYTVPTIANTLSYIWTLPNGVIDTINSNSITVDFSVTAGSGDISVMGNNLCGDGVASNLSIVVDPLPVSAGTITGQTTVCQGQLSETYTVPAITHATSYTWTLPTGTSGTSTTNSITVNYGTSAVSGNITVVGNNLCGDGTASSLPIVVDPLPVTAGTITGPISVCQGQLNETYNIPAITHATSYIWTLPSGVSGTSNTNSITVNYSDSAMSGDIIVVGNNLCGDGESSTLLISVDPLPVSAGIISGLTQVCQGQLSETYTVPAIMHATAYMWTLPTGVTGTSTTNSIIVDYGIGALSGNITVVGNNSCGDGVAATLPIVVDPLPENAGIISGPTDICEGQLPETYSVPTIANATTYIWTLPAGATGTSTTNTITVTYGATAVAGNISVTGNNTCGDGMSASLPIVINPTPLTPTITSVGNILQSSATSGNQWYNQNGIIAGATNQIYTAPVDGDYYVIVTLLECSSEPSNNIPVSFASIEPGILSDAISIFPNPISHQLIIEFTGNTETLKLEILNAAGQIVYSDFLLAKKVINTNDFAAGMYFIKLQSDHIFEIRKVIKE